MRAPPRARTIPSVTTATSGARVAVSSDAPTRVYDLLLARAATQANADVTIDEVIIGLTWTLCRASADDDGPARIGLAMTPQQPTRVLPWPGTLAGRPLAEIAPWLRSWSPHEATVGMAAANVAIRQKKGTP